MDHVGDIKELFKAVCVSQKNTLNIPEWSIRHAVRIMGNAYRPNPNWETNKENISLRYDEPSHRCAYLLKYAMLHTALVYDLLQQAYYIHRVKTTIQAKQKLNLCSLGSGPGTDIVALLFFLQDNNFLKPCQASLVDQSIGWKGVFDSVISNLRSTCYSVSKMVSEEYFSFEYLEANLLNFRDGKVVETVRNADIITMVKFISAAACKDTSKMLKKIFNEMKPDALLLFIDNAAGGFHDTFKNNAKRCGLKSVFGPLKHYKYEEAEFKIETLGVNSQYETKVTAEMWIKEESSANQSHKVHTSLNVRDNSCAGSFYEIDYPMPQSAVFVNQGLSIDNQRFYNSAQHVINMTDVHQQNIRLQDDSPVSKEDDPAKCCVIM